MASEMSYRCDQGHKTGLGKRVFEALRELSARGPVSNCPVCGGARGMYRLFDFGLQAGRADCKVLAAFLPRAPDVWQQKDERWVTFYPFLVVMERTDNQARAFWLPYWHAVEGTTTREIKYGQWAPFLNKPLFEDLIAQVREGGYV